jgi:TolB-like protein/Tfp pilus assembly protein PilF
LADVFLSYKAEDRSRLARLVDALEADGLCVWWDAHIGGGDKWRETIQQQLDRAGCVLVAWSKASVGSQGHFVWDEAGRAQRRGVYVPIRLDQVDPPLRFGETQALPLQGWKGDRDDPRYQAVLTAVRTRLGIASRPPSTPGQVRTAGGIDRRTVIAAGAVAAASAGVGAWYVFTPDSAGANSIAVLPFANLSGDPAQAYFSDGIAEELRGALARIPQLKVIGRTSSEIVRDLDAVVAAKKLGVTRIVTGSVRRSPAMIRIAAQLVSGRDGVELWSKAYDRPPGDVLRIQSEIAQNVAAALRIEFGGAKRNSLTAVTDNPQAHDLYLKALALRRAGQDEANFRAAIRLLDQATALDPNFAQAYAHKAEIMVDVTGYYAKTTVEFERGYERAIANARKAIALAPNLALGHSALAYAFADKLDFRGALAEYQRALDLFAGESEVLAGYSMFMSFTGHADEGLAAAVQALSLDPLNPRSHAMRANAHFYARQYMAAARSYRAVLEHARVSPDSAHAQLGNCLMLLGKTQEARHEFGQVPADNVFRVTSEAILGARTGDRRAAISKLETLHVKFGDSAIYQQAQIRAQLGQREQALAALNRAWEVRDPGLLQIRADPFIDPIRDDPRFGALERRMGLA